MSDPETQVSNWFGDVSWTPARQVTPATIDEVVAVVRDKQYPSPIRAVGSNHSTTPCAAAEGGTTMFMSGMTAIVSIDGDTVTAQAGARYIEVAEALREHDLQFFVNIELGDLTMGAAATVGTKESAFPGEHGQVASYLVSARVVTAAGEVRVFDESDPDLMRAFRSSHGTFGITCEVTFRVRPIQPMSVRHEVYKLDDYLEALPGLLQSDDALMMFLDPLGDRIAVERRRYHDDAGSKRGRPSHWQWRFRNKMWRDVGPSAAYVVSKYAWPDRLRELLLSLLTRVTFPILRYVVRGSNTVASDQQINYPPVSNDCKYTFSIWTFPVERYPEALRAYFDFCKQYRDEHGFRLTLPSVGYRTFQDRSALLSYTYDGDSLTIDPVSNPLPGWDEFLHAYNAFAVRFDGTPLLNQSKFIDRAAATGAFGERLDELARRRREIDPSGRFLSPFFAEIVG